MDWIGAFAANLADGLFWPFVVLSIVAAVVGLQSFVERQQNRYEYLSHEYGNTTWRMHAAVQGALAMWISWALLAAVPEPDYIYKTKTVEVEKIVNEAVDFNEAYKACMDTRWTDTLDDKPQEAFCNTTAKELVLGKPNVKIVEKPVVKKVYYTRATQYRTLFNTCMGKDVQEGGWAIEHSKDKTAEEFRNERIKLCDAQITKVLND